MSKFYAVNKETGEKWKARLKRDDDQIVLSSEGVYLTLREYDYETEIEPLNLDIWKIVKEE